MRLARTGLFALLLVLPALPVAAQQPPLPRERPAVETTADPLPAADEAVPLPRDRPAATPPDTEPPSPPSPERIYQSACPAVLNGQVAAEALPPLAARQCGTRSPLAVSAVLVNGRMVPLSVPATLNCGMATALPGWVAAIEGYLRARENTGIARLLVGTSYMCRGRNRVVGADISEHGFANALDVVGFELEDGRRLTLPAGWEPALAPAGRLLRFAHDSACARFTTTLGPEANALHADHLHVDLGCHGSTCTARLCE